MESGENDAAQKENKYAQDLLGHFYCSVAGLSHAEGRVLYYVRAWFCLWDALLCFSELPDEEQEQWEKFVSGPLSETNKKNTVNLVSPLSSWFYATFQLCLFIKWPEGLVLCTLLVSYLVFLVLAAAEWVVWNSMSSWKGLPSDDPWSEMFKSGGHGGHYGELSNIVLLQQVP